MNKLAITTFSVAIIFLNGCSKEAPKLQKYDRHVNYVQTQAIIVVKLEDLSYVDLSRVYKVATTPTNLADPNIREQQEARLDLRGLFGASPSTVEPLISNEYRVLRNSRSFVPYTYAESIYTIPPGAYYIAFIEYQNGSNMYHTLKPGITSNKTIEYGAFDIKPGAVLYLGDISCTWKDRNQIQNLTISDNITEVKSNLLKAGYKNISEKIVTAKFYPKGTMISEIADINCY